MNYNYAIKNQKIYEFEGKEITYDYFCNYIKFLVENTKSSNIFSGTFRRKIDWLKENHPELFL